MLCRLIPWWISRALDARHPLPQRVRRHLEACPDCRAQFRALEALDRTLSHPAPPLEAPPFLTARVQAAVHAPASRPPPVRLWRPAWLGLAGAAVAAVALGWWAFRAGPAAPVPAALPQMASPLEEVLSVERRIGSLAGRLHRDADAPLQREWVAVHSDLEQAAGFLAARWKDSGGHWLLSQTAASTASGRTAGAL